MSFCLAVLEEMWHISLNIKEMERKILFQYAGIYNWVIIFVVV